MQGRLLHKDPSKRMSVSQGLRHPWITEKNAEVPLSAGANRWLGTGCAGDQRACLRATLCHVPVQAGIATRRQCRDRGRPHNPPCPCCHSMPPCATEIISRLETFTHQNRIKCLLMTIAAHHLSDEEIGGLRKVRALACPPAWLLAGGTISAHAPTAAMQLTLPYPASWAPAL